MVKAFGDSESTVRSIVANKLLIIGAVFISLPNTTIQVNI